MNAKNIALIFGTLIIGLSTGYFLKDNNADRASDGGNVKNAADGPCAGGAQPLAWRNPMNPSITSPNPAKDPMGMDYVPVCAGDAAGNGPAGTVKIDPTVTQDMGVRVTRAVEKKVARQITTVGRVVYDEANIETLHPKVNGWIDTMFVTKTGEHVQRNTMLLSLYSPELVATEKEYLLALGNWDQLKNSPYKDIRNGAKRLLESSLDRLRFFDVPAHQIRALRKTRKVLKNLHIHAPSPGVVTHIGVRDGAYVTPASEIYTIVDLSHVWVLADLYEYELPWVKSGDAAEITLKGLPGRVFSSHISYIYPYLDPKTRTNKVRLVLDNSAGQLKPDMFGDVTISASVRKRGVFVPMESVLFTGKRAHLFVQTAPGRFEPRTVRTGISAEGLVEILTGVKAGEQVVSSGQFLIDSESSIREAAAKMVAPKSQPAIEKQGMDMQGMQMNGMDMGDHSAGKPNGTDAGRPKGKGQGVPNHMNMKGMDMGKGKGVRREE